MIASNWVESVSSWSPSDVRTSVICDFSFGYVIDYVSGCDYIKPANLDVSKNISYSTDKVE